MKMFVNICLLLEADYKETNVKILMMNLLLFEINFR